MNKLLLICFALIFIQCEQKKCSNIELNSEILDVQFSPPANRILDSLGISTCANATSFSLIANKHFEFSNFERSINWCLKAIENSDSANLNDYLLISDSYRFLYRFDSSLHYLREAQGFVSEKDGINEAYLQFRLGQVYFESNRFEQSLDCFRTAIEKFKVNPTSMIDLIALYEWVYLNLYKLDRIEESCIYAKEFLPDAYIQSNCNNE
jgi:tetratricopeptide (TPR) repeat protein